MSTGGWIFMLTTWTAITALVAFCYWKTLTLKSRKVPPAAEGTPSGGPAPDRPPEGNG